MRYRVLASAFQLLTVIVFFLPIYYIQETMISGWAFIFDFESDFENVLASRIISAVMAIGLIVSLITYTSTWFFRGNKKVEDSSIISFNLTLGVGLVLIVVQGAYMSYLGYIWIGIMIATAYLRSLDKK